MWHNPFSASVDIVYCMISPVFTLNNGLHKYLYAPVGAKPSNIRLLLTYNLINGVPDSVRVLAYACIYPFFSIVCVASVTSELLYITIY